VTARQAVPAWFTATSIEVFLVGLLADVTAEAELVGLLAGVAAEAELDGLLAPQPAG
jgi:hypothetical protein